MVDRLIDSRSLEFGDVFVDDFGAGEVEEFQMINPQDGVGDCRPAYRKWLLGLVLVHCMGVLAEPLFFFSRSDFQAGPEFFGLRRSMAPYVDWMYLDHGYFFFAPNPGPSHLVAIQSKVPEPPRASSLRGDAIVFPNRNEHWPRLLYHRYFMLSEFYNNSFAPTALSQQDKSDRMFVERWESDRRFYEVLQRSISKSAFVGKRAMQGADGLGVELLRLERPLPGPEEILKGVRRLGDSRELIVLPEGPEPAVEPLGAGVP